MAAFEGVARDGPCGKSGFQPASEPLSSSMASLSSFLPPPADYPNLLLRPEPQRPSFGCQGWVLLGLVLLCAAPRSMLVGRYASIAPDGPLYIRLAQAIGSGDIRGGLEPFSVNLYPFVLAAVQGLGFPWELGGKVWGVLISSLTVLPLFGWVRRQFSDSVAVTACLLYATHPTFIRCSPEVMRDSTFWFLFALSIYGLWRAVVEVRWWLFPASGAAIALTALTRFEGLFLLIPLGLWFFWRWRALRQGRATLLVGLLAAVLPFVLALAAAKFLWFGGRPLSAVYRLTPLELVQNWLSATTCSQPSDLTAPAALSSSTIVWRFFPLMTRGLSPVFALLMFGGLWHWRRVWARRDHQPLFYVSLAILGGIWIAMWHVGESSPRYALSIALMASPFAALGLLGLMGWLLELAERRSWSSGARAAAVAAPLAVALGIGLATAVFPKYAHRAAEVRLADWIRREYGPQARLAAPPGIIWVIQYHAAAGPCRMFPWTADAAAVAAAAREFKPDVLLLRATDQLSNADCRRLGQELEDVGLALVASSRLPEGCAYHVIARHGAGRQP